MRKTQLTILICSLFFASCSKTIYTYTGIMGNNTQTEVILERNNFKTLGTFSGTITEKKLSRDKTNVEGIISQARKQMLENAKLAGVELTGSRTVTNVAVDMIQNEVRVIVTYSATIIEFTD